MTDVIVNFLKTSPPLKLLSFGLSILIVYSYFLAVLDFTSIDYEALTALPSNNLFTKISSAISNIKEFKIEPKPAAMAFLVTIFSFWVNTTLYRLFVMISAPALSQQSYSHYRNIASAHNNIITSSKRWSDDHNRKTLSNTLHCCASLYTLFTLSIIDILTFHGNITFAIIFTLLIFLTTAYMWLIIIRYVIPCSVLRLNQPFTYTQTYTLLRDINS
jgi:hypothetical protein